MAQWLGLDAAIVGVASRCGEDPRLVYDQALMIQIFIDQGMDAEEAEEWVDLNIAGAWIGDTTPLLMVSFDEEQKATIERDGLEALLGVDAEA